MRHARPNLPQIEYKRLDELKPYDPAARLHSKPQHQKLTALLERHGQVTPVIIDAANVIIDGHLVVEALKAMGRDQVMVLVAASRDEAEIKAIRLALNRVPQDSKWNNAKLKDEFEALLQLGYDLDLTGFDAVEIDTAFAIDDPGVGGTEDLPAGPAHDAAPVSQIGDLILLDRNRVICGDARDPNTIARLMAGEVARMAFLDVPYNVPIANFVTKGPHREFAMASGEMSNGEFVGFLEQALTAASSALCDGAIMYACIDWRGLMSLSAAAVLANLTQLNLCVWAKTNAGMGSFYRSQHELVPVFKKGSAPHLNNFELGQKGRSRSNVWTYRGMNSFGQERDDLLADSVGADVVQGLDDGHIIVKSLHPRGRRREANRRRTDRQKCSFSACASRSADGGFKIWVVGIRPDGIFGWAPARLKLAFIPRSSPRSRCRLRTLLWPLS